MPAHLAPTGAPCWIDLFSSETDRAAAFYGGVFGWTAESAGEEYGGYVNFFRNGVMIAGMMRNDGSAGMPDAWTTYLSVADAKATAEAAVAAGGQVHLEPMDVMGLGTMGLVADPGGASVGLWQAGSFAGYGLYDEPGTPAWHELHTRDYAAVVEFYRTVFGVAPLSVGDTDEFRYSQLMTGELAYAGVMDGRGFLPGGVPSSWQTYIRVDDVDATIATATGLGGRCTEPAMDTPFGRLAALVDPTGATIKLMTPPAA